MRSRVVDMDRVGGVEGLQNLLDSNPTWKFVGGGSCMVSNTYTTKGGNGRPSMTFYDVF
jgi:hypothetical protein